MLFNKVLVFGVGLIGGSFARSLKLAGAAGSIVGMDRSPAFLARALELGLIDRAGGDLAEAMAGADLVLLAAPVAQTEKILVSLLPFLEAGTIVTDAGSTKGDVVASARRALGARVSQFVPGHPVAGRESNGPDAAMADLYRGKKAVLTPLAENSEADIARVASAWSACGAVIHRLAPEEHDKVFAAVSHLPHLLAYALVDDIANKPHANLLFQYAASGFRDFTRIAASSPEMWRDISLANQAALLSELDAYLSQLTGLRSALAAADGAALEAVYGNARRARRQWIAAIEAAEAPPGASGAE
ncbi:MAG TPA: prephenate dehydrogenase/arogenate dehydrogenase family protein [Janthinobacterium sp.]|jgi:prephenate dehydrogenase|nr:prephenate dehydrogenase/arogenate dehydrogenase family protein [Janthinobacterium sp.]